MTLAQFWFVLLVVILFSALLWRGEIKHLILNAKRRRHRKDAEKTN